MAASLVAHKLHVSASQGNMHTIPAHEVQQLQQWMTMLGHMPGSSSMHNVHPSSVGLMSANLAPLTGDQNARHELPDFRNAAAFQGLPASFQSSLPSFQGNGTLFCHCPCE